MPSWGIVRVWPAALLCALVLGAAAAFNPHPRELAATAQRLARSQLGSWAGVPCSTNKLYFRLLLLCWPGFGLCALPQLHAPANRVG